MVNAGGETERFCEKGPDFRIYWNGQGAQQSTHTNTTTDRVKKALESLKRAPNTVLFRPPGRWKDQR